MNGEVEMPDSPLRSTWVIIAGAILGALTLIFLMGLVLLSAFGREVPCSSVFLVIATLSLGAALSAAFLGGSASARGTISVPVIGQRPFAVSMSGGVAMLIITLFVTNSLFGNRNCGPVVTMSCPVGFQPHVVDVLRFGFCYPREGWELDTGAIGVQAADLYIRRSENRDVGLHFHVSLIPPGYAGKPDDYSEQVAQTWRQLDPEIKQSKTFVGGRDAYMFSLHVKDRKGRTRPAEITHIYLDSERLLEVIITTFPETSSDWLGDLQKVKSSLAFART